MAPSVQPPADATPPATPQRMAACHALKNYSTLASAQAALGPQARDVQWVRYPHYRLLSYRLC